MSQLVVQPLMQALNSSGAIYVGGNPSLASVQGFEVSFKTTFPLQTS